MPNEVVLYQSDRAAHFGTLSESGWFNRHGVFYGNGPNAEHAARFCGATHDACQVDPSHGMYPMGSCCAICDAQMWMHGYEHLPRQVWDCETPVAVYGTELIFHSVDQVHAYASTLHKSAGDLRLVLCEPVNAKAPSASDVYVMDLDGRPAPPEIEAVFASLADALNLCPPLSWRALDLAVEIPEEVLIALGSPASASTVNPVTTA